MANAAAAAAAQSQLLMAPSASSTTATSATSVISMPPLPPHLAFPPIDFKHLPPPSSLQFPPPPHLMTPSMLMMHAAAAAAGFNPAFYAMPPHLNGASNNATSNGQFSQAPPLAPPFGSLPAFGPQPTSSTNVNAQEQQQQVPPPPALMSLMSLNPFGI